MVSTINLVSSILVLIGTTIIVRIYLYFKDSFNYFKRKNIPFFQPSFFVGNANKSFGDNFGIEIAKFYKKFKELNVDYGGIYMITKPLFIVLNPAIIKHILTKDFNVFYSRGVYHNEEKEFITAHLFALAGAPWKKLRSNVSPAFSSSKLKGIVDTMLLKSGRLEEKLEELSETRTAFDVKELSAKIMTDIVCTTVFGIENDSVFDVNNEFYKHGRGFFKNNFIHSLKMILALSWPQLFEKLNINLTKKEFADFFIKNITEVVNYRENNSIHRPDFMELLIKLKNKINIDDENTKNDTIEGITLQQLIAQCFVYFLAGLDTSSSAVTFCVFELAQDLSLQDKLREEIRTNMEKHGGKLNYEGIMEMKLLDKILNETLRKYPSALVLNRIAAEDYKIPDTDCIIDKGTAVVISVLALHMDPEYYPNPEKFDPERFSEEEIAKRPPYTYLPFGEGPKHCIGYRFGLLQSKIGIIHMIKNFELVLDPSVKLPLELRSEMIVISTTTPILVNVKKLK